MKKLLVLFVSAALVLSMAAVSLAATTVTGDFRYDMYEDETPTTTDDSYAYTDLRIRVTGDLSDSVKATANFKWKRGTGSYGAGSSISTDLDEFYATWKQSWGTMKVGYYEFKFTPSRVLLKSGQYHVWNKADELFDFNFPVAEGFTGDVLVQPYAQNSSSTSIFDSSTKYTNSVNDGSYGFALTYKAENWGTQVTYANFQDDDNDLTAFDVYYMINDEMKVFVDAVDYSKNKKDSDRYSVYGIDGIDPVLGFAWTNIAGTKLYGAFEYAINKRFEDTANEYSEYTVNLKYKLTNNVGLEMEHYIIGDSLTKDMLRLRYQF